jgi:chemotaxis signal transduction protein
MSTADGAISGVAKVGDRLLVVLDLEALFGTGPIDDAIAEAA